MGKINSRQKGAAGEREAAHFLSGLGFTARRSVQNGVTDGRDIVVDDLPWVYFEVKRDNTVKFERAEFYSAIEQAKDKAKDKPWCLLWRGDNQMWRLTFWDDKCGLVTVHQCADIAACLKMLNTKGASDEG